MVDFWKRMLNRQTPLLRPAEPLSAAQIDAGYRLHWTRTALAWDAGRQAEMAERVAAAIAAPGFENNALERRFRVEGLDEQAHSGASLLALADVLRAVDAWDAGAGAAG